MLLLNTSSLEHRDSTAAAAESYIKCWWANSFCSLNAVLIDVPTRNVKHWKVETAAIDLMNSWMGTILSASWLLEMRK